VYRRLIMSKEFEGMAPSLMVEIVRRRESLQLQGPQTATVVTTMVATPSAKPTVATSSNAATAASAAAMNTQASGRGPSETLDESNTLSADMAAFLNGCSFLFVYLF
jgi:hypothetical protein